MDTLLDAVKNALRMIDGWSGDADTIEALLDEVQAELLRIPHTRGDEPPVLAGMQEMIEYSPHAWG